MGRGSIPEPNEHDRADAMRIVHQANQGIEGEAGAIASTPAIINGIVDALRPMGVTDVLMPASPQNVWRAIQAAKGESA